jgi:hypothetical protein
MAATPGYVLAATAGQATSVSLAWLGDAATAVLPTTVSTALDASFKDLGYVTGDGATTSTAISSTDQGVFGSTAPVRTIITGEVLTIALTALESNKVSEALVTRQTLASITVTSATMSTTRGPGRDSLYALVLDAVDGSSSSAFRRVYPRVRVTNVGDAVIGFNNVIQYPFTFTAYTDASGVSEYRYTKVTGLT